MGEFFKNILRFHKKKRNSNLLEPSTDLSSTSECSEIERVFRYIDENGDGKISPEELQTCLRAVGGRRLTAEEAEAAVESSDSDGDGFLSLEEFERLMEGDSGVSTEEKREDLRAAFAMYESRSRSGCITAKSLKKMLHRLGEEKTAEECKGMIRVFDLDGDGVLSFDEFGAMMR